MSIGRLVSRSIVLCLIAAGLLLRPVHAAEPPAEAPYPPDAGAHPVPGLIQAEDYDLGGEGVGYHDLTPGNAGDTYRQDDVDIKHVPDGATVVGWFQSGEWLAYSIDVQDSGSYDVVVRMGAANTPDRTLILAMDGTEIGRLRAPHIDSWTAPLQEAALRGVSLTAGTHVLRLQVGPLDWIDVDWVRIDPSAAPPAAAAPSASGGDASAGGRMLLHHPAQGPFFADATGQGVVLTGAHTWSDGGQDIDGHPFDWTGYLDWLQAHNMNFVRFWMWESASSTRGDQFAPQPWLRTGPGNATDGQPKWDLTQLNQSYFDRLHSRLEAARERGIYVSIMLGNGWSSFSHTGAADQWPAHPFNVANNVNGINGGGFNLHTLSPQTQAARDAQATYINHLVDTVADLDNVLIEPANEAGDTRQTLPWMEWVASVVRAREAGMALQHPIWITSGGEGAETNASLLASSAEAIAPTDWNNAQGYKTSPPPNDGRKVVILDTDHLWGIGGSPDWVWKAFTRGYNLAFMDPYDGALGWDQPQPWMEAVRQALGAARRAVVGINVSGLRPRGDLASSGYALADPGTAYVVYAPGGSVSLDLTNANGSFQASWLPPVQGDPVSAGVVAGGNRVSLSAPFPGDAVLILQLSNSTTS